MYNLCVFAAVCFLRILHRKQLAVVLLQGQDRDAGSTLQVI